MWGENSKNCESNCQCSGLITESFKINSGNNGTKRKQEDAQATNFKIKMKPHSLNFNTSPTPLATKRRILGELQNSFTSPINRLASPLKFSPQIERLKSPVMSSERLKSPMILQSPLAERLRSPVDRLSPLTMRNFMKRSSKLSRVFEERSRFKLSMENKENEELSATMVKLDVEEETRDCSFGEQFQLHRSKTMASWSEAKLDFTDSLPARDSAVPEKDEAVEDLETLQDLELEFEADNFDNCTNYEIISTDSPDIISRGRSSRKITAKTFDFGAPLADDEQSTSFNRPTANRMLNFDEEDFEFTSPALKKTASVKKSLKFNETHTKITKTDSGISLSPKLRLYTSESTTSVESGFVSELEDQFLDIEESNSPKVANFNELLSGKIKSNIITDKNFLRKPLNRSLSFNPEPRSLLSILESPVEKKKRECEEVDAAVSKRRKGDRPELRRPVLQRAFSENNASSIMSALARSESDPDLIGDFSQPFLLPATPGHHSDLRSVSCDTLASLLHGEYGHHTDYQVIDCRYPYEYEGGHILGAVNLYTQDQVLSLVNKPLEPRDHKRSILIFHCEFSLERGPKLSRFLRSSDRAKNKENYPSLHYPEVYLLHEGYRAFYQRYPDLCSPVGYTAMLDPEHKHLLRRHRSVSQPSTSTQHRRHRLLM